MSFLTKIEASKDLKQESAAKNLSNEAVGTFKYVCYRQILFLEIKKKMLGGIEDLFFRGKFSLQACLLEPILTV